MVDIQFHLKKKKKKRNCQEQEHNKKKNKVILNTSFLFLNQENAQNEPLVESHKKKELAFTFVC